MARRPADDADERPGAKQIVDGIAISRSLSDVLAEEHPLIFLLEVSQTYAILDERARADPERIDLVGVLRSLAESELAGFRAMGYAMSQMIGRAEERDAFAKDHDQAAKELPEWLYRMGEAESTGCWSGYDNGALDDILGIGIRFADGCEGTIAIVTCCRTGEIVDAYVSTEPYADAALDWTTHDPCAAGLSKITNDSALAIATRALNSSEPTGRNVSNDGDDWMSGRALIEWTLSLLATPRSAPQR